MGRPVFWWLDWCFSGQTSISVDRPLFWWTGCLLTNTSKGVVLIPWELGPDTDGGGCDLHCPISLTHVPRIARRFSWVFRLLIAKF